VTITFGARPRFADELALEIFRGPPVPAA